MVARERWEWSLPRTAGLAAAFLLVDLAFFVANVAKIPDGGWFPLARGGGGVHGHDHLAARPQILGERLRDNDAALERVPGAIADDPPARVPGTAIYMTGDPATAPRPRSRTTSPQQGPSRAGGAIPSMRTEDVPRVPSDERHEVHDLGRGFYQVIIQLRLHGDAARAAESLAEAGVQG